MVVSVDQMVLVTHGNSARRDSPKILMGLNSFGPSIRKSRTYLIPKKHPNAPPISDMSDVMEYIGYSTTLTTIFLNVY